MLTQQQEIEFGELLKRNNQTISSVCFRHCGGNAYYFDELRQECAVAIWKEFSRYGISRFRGDSAESTWIYQISYHAVVDYLRNHHHNDFLTVSELYNMEPRSEGSDDWNLIDELTEQLNDKERALLVYFLNDELYSAIARSEGITETNARKRMSRLIHKLKMLIHKK